MVINISISQNQDGVYTAWLTGLDSFKPSIADIENETDIELPIIKTKSHRHLVDEIKKLIRKEIEFKFL